MDFNRGACYRRGRRREAHEAQIRRSRTARGRLICHTLIFSVFPCHATPPRPYRGVVVRQLARHTCHTSPRHTPCRCCISLMAGIARRRGVEHQSSAAERSGHRRLARHARASRCAGAYLNGARTRSSLGEISRNAREARLSPPEPQPRRLVAKLILARIRKGDLQDGFAARTSDASNGLA